MPAAPQHPAGLDCRSAEGRILARLLLWPDPASDLTGESHPLVRWPAAEALARHEEPVQLRERYRYVYRLEPLDGSTDLQLLATRVIRPSPASDTGAEVGFIEPGDQCGLLPLLVTRRGATVPVAQAAVEVRSVKMDYREHYRGMLDHLAERSAALLLDSRAATRLRLSSAWRTDRAVLEQQLEFLRYTLSSARFQGALDEVLRNPHRRLEDQRREQPIGRPFKAGSDLARRIGRVGDRVSLPPDHPLRLAQPCLTSLPARISLRTRGDFLDTPENCFIKMVLVEFRDFLAAVAIHLQRAQTTDAAEWRNARLLAEVRSQGAMLDGQLSGSFLPDLGPPGILPLGSPVLQRKAGYRELLHLWLQFHVGAQLSWDGGQDVWQGGSRDVATLYEYWLFFQLEALFRAKFACLTPLHAVLLERDAGIVRMNLRRGIELKTPIGGVWAPSHGRRLAAEFHFNRRFPRRGIEDHGLSGSWTRNVRPDYTISIWPAEFTRDEAEREETMVHILFDAKYRVDFARSIFGEDDDIDEIDSQREVRVSTLTAAKYSDLLKMHAYRDAIRRSAGAYVLYPGQAGDGRLFEQFAGFHEVLPGLGAFAIRPRLDGQAEGMAELSRFLDEVIAHLANRTTARERLSYHARASYSLREEPIGYGTLVLAERDVMSGEDRALPPAEHSVVIAWYDSPAQLAWTCREGFANVRLGLRRGSWRIPPDIASARHLLLRTHGGVVAPGLLALCKTGYQVFTAKDLLKSGYPGRAGGEIYAVFEVTPDPAYDNVDWDGAILMDVLEEFEARSRNRPEVRLGRTSPYPRTISLRDLLKARITEPKGSAMDRRTEATATLENGDATPTSPRTPDD